MIDSAEDRSEPPPRQIEWIHFEGKSRPPGGGQVEVEVVHVAATKAFDPYRSDTLHVSTSSPLGSDYVRYLTSQGDWAEAKWGTQVPNQGFEMPAGFSAALENAFQGKLEAELTQLQKSYDNLATRADEAISDRDKLIAVATRTGESAVRRVEQLEAEVAELREELEAWREGRFSR